MVYQANVINIMIVSPGDVQDERNIIEERIWAWNSKHSEEKRIFLHPLRWEKDSFSEVGEHPQNFINQQVVDRSDMAIAVFWSKIGTATENHKSGSVEELEKHVDENKPAMIYFSKKDLPQNYDREQFDKLSEFKREYATKCLYSEYENHMKLIDLLDDHLHRAVVKMSKNIPSISEDNEIKIDKNVQASVPNLSELALQILLAANESSEKLVWKNQIIQTGENEFWKLVRAGDKQFGKEGDRRSQIESEHAVEELIKLEYLRGLSPENQLSEISKQGYDFIDKYTSSLNERNDSESETFGGELLLLQKMKRKGPINFTEYYERGLLNFPMHGDYYSTEFLSHSEMLSFKDDVDKLLETKLVDRKELDYPASHNYGETFVGDFLISPTSKGYQLLDAFQTS
ncbi:hypothetical protein Mal35_18680 [Gimesia maris]|uniref:hypothetical protein n=1 Tax=Gimesia maris TaxID=122 RepID=UPI0011898B8D|nr:hypothetical protein [Gimesia maris]QDT78419.1 hypothetical protein Mal35_18680 [Gimesia maris]